MNIRKYNWFTVLELVITISIIVVLSTISFVSFTWYVSDSRDSKRIVDINSISASLEVFFKKNSWVYPKPSNSIIISYTWSNANIPFSYLWILKDDLNLDFNSIPKDPLTNDYYVFATTINKKYYEVASTIENKNKIDTSSFIFTNKLFAESDDEVAYIVWNYKQSVEKWNYFKHIILTKNFNWEYKIPREDSNIWVLNSSWQIVLNPDIYMIENWWIYLP